MDLNDSDSNVSFDSDDEDDEEFKRQLVSVVAKVVSEEEDKRYCKTASTIKGNIYSDSDSESSDASGEEEHRYAEIIPEHCDMLTKDASSDLRNVARHPEQNQKNDWNSKSLGKLLLQNAKGYKW